MNIPDGLQSFRIFSPFSDLHDGGLRERKTWNTYEEGSVPYKRWFAKWTDSPTAASGTNKEDGAQANDKALFGTIDNWIEQPEKEQLMPAVEEEDMSAAIPNQGSMQKLGQLGKKVGQALQTGMSKLAVTEETDNLGGLDEGTEDEAVPEHKVSEDEQIPEHETTSFAEAEEAPPEGELIATPGEESETSAAGGQNIGNHKEGKGHQHKEHSAGMAQEHIGGGHATDIPVGENEHESHAEDKISENSQSRNAATVTVTVYASAPTSAAGRKGGQTQVEDQSGKEDDEGMENETSAPEVEVEEEEAQQTEDEEELPANDEDEANDEADPGQEQAEDEEEPLAKDEAEVSPEQSDDDEVDSGEESDGGGDTLNDSKNISNLMSTPPEAECNGKAPPAARSLKPRRMEYRGDPRRVRAAARYGSRRHDWWL